MENEILITEENLKDFLNQDIAGLAALIDCPEFSIDTTPEPIQKLIVTKTCSSCGNLLFEGPKNEFRCGSCGCILYKTKEVK